MSFDTWKDEFYPTPAHKVEAEKALERSLRKWVGLREENLTKHDVRLKDYDVIGQGHVLAIDANSCALCEHFYSDWDDYSRCQQCPLTETLGHPCDISLVADKRSPYHSLLFNDPEPMIKALEDAIKRQG